MMVSAPPKRSSVCSRSVDDPAAISSTHSRRITNWRYVVSMSDDDRVSTAAGAASVPAACT